jgi:hypothetical protein
MVTGKKMNAIIDKLNSALEHMQLYSETEKKTHLTKAVAAVEKVIKDSRTMCDAMEAKKTKKPKKLNDYMVYANKVRPEVVKRLGPVPVTEVAREIGRMWRELKAEKEI